MNADFFNPCFLIPYYNHPRHISTLVNILQQYNIDILIIDDGSNMESKQELQKLNAKFLESNFMQSCIDSNILIYERKENGGKGAAIKDGLKIAHILHYTHAFQIDADMQHDLSYIPQFLSLSQNNKNALICGNPQYDSTAPKSRLYGRKITDFWVCLNTLSFSIKDSMCGFRIYPLDSINLLLKKCHSNKMDFDIEILVLAYKNRIPLKWIDINVFYDKEGISHFKALRDNLLISKMHAKHFFALPFFIVKKIFYHKN